MKAVVLLSGGIDSATCLWKAKADKRECLALSIYYGQRNERQEMASAYRLAEAAEVRRVVCPLPTLGRTGDVVHARNSLLIALATSVGLTEGAGEVWFGANRNDYSSFLDCRPEFFAVTEQALKAGGVDIRIMTPLIHLSKIEVIDTAIKLGVPIEETFSCYDPAGSKPCRKCAACVLRSTALETQR